MSEAIENSEELPSEKRYLQIWSNGQIETHEVPVKLLEVVDETTRGILGHIGLTKNNREKLGAVGDVVELINSETGESFGLRVIGKFPLELMRKKEGGLTVSGIPKGSHIVVAKYLPEALATHQVPLALATENEIGDQYGLKIPAAYAKLMGFQHPEGSNIFTAQSGRIKVFKTPNDKNPTEYEVKLVSGGGKLKATVDSKARFGLNTNQTYLRVINRALEIYLS